MLCETIRKYCDRYHLLDVLTKVNECMADKQRRKGGKAVQVPYLNHTLRAEMHLGKHGSHGLTIKGMSIDKVKIGRFTVVCLVTWRMSIRRLAGGDLTLIQTSLVVSCKCT